MSYFYKASIILLICLLYSNILLADEIWRESFSTPDKGYWGGGSDMSGISTWTLDASACTLTDAADYIKTVT
ncbi:MAG: hypothetical protein L3J74_01385, partial [Bacteroidales bacterium]|nr:hypothetical protein [Bacteroidales bacterium]